MAQRLPQIPIDAPDTQLMNWAGFSAKKDKTMLPPNFLVDPAQNCLIPDGDKVLPRKGTQTVFQGANPILQEGSIGGYTKFKNFIGIEMDVKAYRDATQGEQVLVLFNGVYVPITTNPNLNFNGFSRIYFSTYTDSTLNLAEEKRIPRLLWVNGYDHKDGTGRVFSWTGGIAVIDNIVGNQIFLPTGVTWRQLGFTEHFPFPTIGPHQIHVTINGVEYFSTSVAQLDGNVLTLNTTPIAAIGDIVTSSIQLDPLAAPMDYLKMNKNYVYYGNFNLRQWWMSNQFGRFSVTRITESNAAQDDLIINPNTNYIGTGRHIFKLIISSINPPINEQVFIGNGLDDAIFQGSGGQILPNGYTGTPGNRNVYKVSILGDTSLTASILTAFTVGETITGQTSGAQGIVVAGPISSGGDFSYGLRMITANSFIFGENVRGTNTGLVATIDQVLAQNWVQYTKNGTIINIDTGQGPLPVSFLTTAGPITLTDGLQITFANYGGYTVGSIFQLTMNQGGSDQFTWQKDNTGTINGPFNVTTSLQQLFDGAVATGVFIKWGAINGHSVGDFWIIEVNQAVTRPWSKFYYTLDFISQESLRRPGEGYVYSLPANFWTSDTFEDSMYVNTSNGEWGYTNPTLSADLLSEDISFTPLKQVSSSKVLYPYLTGHNRNDMLFIDETKNLNSLGRLILLEKVQMKNISDFVLNKFQSLSFVGGSIIFQDNTTWITSPEDNVMIPFNERTQYWQPPQFIPNLGILTIIGTSLYTHSALDTATRSLNDPTAEGDDGVEYEVIIRSSTYDHGNRWNKKMTNMGFWEGYVDEAPPMKMRAYFDVDGCSEIKETDIIPVFCAGVVNHGTDGGGHGGGHEDGGDVTIRTNYARYNWNDLGVHHFYFSSIEFRCRAKRHPYEVLSMGINLAQSKYNNKEFTPPESAIDSLLPL